MVQKKNLPCLSLCHKSNCRRPIFSCRWFHRVAAHHTGAFQNQLGKKCATYVSVGGQAGCPCGAARCGNYKSKKVVSYRWVSVRLQLCACTVISDAWTAPAFLNGHRPVPGCSQLPQYEQQRGHRTAPLQTRPIPRSSSVKKVVRHCTFFPEKFGILEKHHVSNDATENAWFLSNLIYLPGNGP
jgi:hypothetical protein